MKQLCEISPCVNTNEDPPAQLKSQPVAEEETENNGIFQHMRVSLCWDQLYLGITLVFERLVCGMKKVSARHVLLDSASTVLTSSRWNGSDALDRAAVPRGPAALRCAGSRPPAAPFDPPAPGRGMGGAAQGRGRAAFAVSQRARTGCCEQGGSAGIRKVRRVSLRVSGQ